MALMISKDEQEAVLTCMCGCDDAVHIKICKEFEDDESFSFLTFMKSNWYSEQDETILKTITKKMKKIIAIICSKDFYYSEIVMSKDDFIQFKEYINSIETD